MNTIGSFMFMLALIAHEYRRRNENPNGREFWQKYKEFFSNIEFVGEWSESALTKKFKILPEEESEQNHFINRINQIPQSEPATIQKIMQVAYNIGQLSYYEGKMPYIEEIITEETSNVKFFDLLTEEQILECKELF